MTKNNSKNNRRFPILLLFLSLLLLFGGASTLIAREDQKDSTGYVPDLSHEYLVTQYADATGQHATFYTITNRDTLIIIDGGWAENEAALREVIAAHGNHVDAWIISHPHKDHAGAFNAVLADPGEITIDKIYDNGFDRDFIAASGEPYDDIEIMETYYSLTKDTENVIHFKRGDVVEICGLTFSIYNAYDDVVLANVGGEKDYQNNASLLFKVSSENSSMLFCSDIKYDMHSTLLSAWGEEIVCDYVQLGHHGNWSFYEEFYDQTGASVFFMDAGPEIADNPDFPASTLKQSLLAKGKTVLTFSTAPNTVTLK